MTTPVDATAIVKSASAEDPSAAAQLLPLVYDQLRQLAARYLASERPDHTLQATALVHEAYVQLIDQTRVTWRDRAHFCAVAAIVMRRVLAENARRRGRLKRQAKGKRIALDDELLVGRQTPWGFEQLDDALTQLASQDERAAKVVEFRFFGGMQVREVAEVLHVSERTVAQDWAYAKAWLLAELNDDSSQ